MTREQSRQAIEGPAEVFGGVVEPALVNRLLNDMGTDPDQLPLMQHALMRMWIRASEAAVEEPQGKSTLITLTLADYNEVGGLARALSNHADEAFTQLPDEQQRIAEVLFRCLSERGPAQRDTRRPVRLDAVAAVAGVSPTQLTAVVEVFRRPDRSFITPSAGVPLRSDTVDIIGFNQSRASSAHRMRETDDDNSRGDCASRRQSPSRDQRCLRWSDVRHL
jgi:Novel STAND NTPase 1